MREDIVTLTLPDPLGKVKIHYCDWGNESAPQTILCVHGLTRNAHDFDWIARALAGGKTRVISLDMPGRGDSPWLEKPLRYGYPLYMAACIALMDNFHVRQVDWIGTSMGGIIGMMIAATIPHRIRKLVLNDIGAHIDAEGLRRIIEYVSTMPTYFTTRAEAEQYLRRNFASFGIESEDVWAAFINHSISVQGEGWRLKTDPNIVVPMRRDTENFTKIEAVNLSALWEDVRCSSLILRGEHSDLLSATTMKAMLSSNIRAVGETIAGCGHAPSLTTTAQINSITRFLRASALDITLPI